MVQESYFGDYAEREEEELRRVREQAALSPPPPPSGYGTTAVAEPPAAPGYSPAGNLFGQAFTQPTPEPAPAPLNPNAGGFRGPENPANVTPGDQYAPNPDMGILDLGRAQEATRIPVWSDFAEQYAIPAVNAAADPLGIQSFLQRETLGTDIGMGDIVVPVTGLDVGLNALTGGGLSGFDDVARMGSAALGGVDNVVRGAFPEPNIAGANYGMSIGGPPINPMGGENVFGVGSQGGWREAVPGTGPDSYDALRESLLARGVPAEAIPPPDVPAFPQRYPSIPEGTMGSEFPEVVGQPEYYNGRATGRVVSENSPAARMGAPLWADPQFATPPPSDAAMRELGVSPLAEIAPQTPLIRPNVDPALTGGGSAPNPPSAELGLGSPPPASLFEPPLTTGSAGATPPPFFGGASPLNAVPPPAAAIPPPPLLGNATPLNLSDPANMAVPRAPLTAPATFPMTADEALAEAQRIGFPIRYENLVQGSALTKQQELDALSAAIDLDKFRRSGPAGHYFESAFGGGGRGASPPSGIAGGATPPPPPGQTMESQGLFDKAMDLLYSPFSGDAGRLLRQDLSQTLNFTNVEQTRQVVGLAARMASSREEALKVVAELDAIKAATDAKVGKPVKMHRPDIPGVRETGSLLNREGSTSFGLGRVPGLGLPVNVMGRFDAGVVEARRVLEYQRFVDNLPNRVLSSGNMQAQAQSYVDMMDVFTGRGRIPFEQALSHAGPLFTSLRFALSIPERVPYMLPVNRLSDGTWELFGPGWREAVREQGGFAATLMGTLYAAQAAGLDVQLEDGVPDGRIKVGNSTYDLTGGVRGYWSAIQKMADGDLMAGAEFVRNKFGPLPGSLIQGLQAIPGNAPEQALGGALQATGLGNQGNVDDFFKFMRPEFFNRGATGSGEDWDRGLAMGLFLFMQDTAKAYRFADGDLGDKLKAAAVALPASFFGVGVQSYPPFPLTAMRDALKDDPRLPDAVRGIEYKDLGPDGKAAVDKLAAADKPEEFKQAIKERDESPSANPVFARNREIGVQITREEDDRKMQIYNALREGRISGEQAREGRLLIGSAANSKRDAARNDPEFKKALEGLPEKNDVNTYLDTYYKIVDKLKGPDGKPDWDAVRAKQEEYVRFVEGRNAETGRALRYEVETTKGAGNMLDALYAQAQPILQKYFGDIKDDYARSTAQKNNPRDDAFLALLGYGKTQSPEAAAILKQMQATLPVGSATPVTAGVGGGTASTAPAPAALGNVGPDGRTVAQITGTAYRSDAERNWYFQSRGLTVPQAGAPAAPRANVAPVPSTGARLPPVAPGEFNSSTASPQQRANFIEAMVGPSNAYASTGIPPSVWAAMGASESNWGRAPSVFGIKGVGSAGGANLQTHEILGGKRVDMPDQFAAYNNLDDAFKHFVDLTSHGRYANAWNHLQQTGDWQGFLHGITQAGYATDKTWPNSIISLASHIEKTYPQINRR